MFESFDFSILEDSEFKEDAVREEIILPIIKALGYNVSGDSRIVRSRSLIHPYVALGSKQRKISIIPDYIFLSENKPYWILDAKSPIENVVNDKHIGQAYSYAIHPEVQADLYALCNGKEFALYSIKKFSPLLHFAIKDIDNYWGVLYRILNPEIKANPKVLQYQPDYGLHLHRLGAPTGFKLVIPAIHTKFISKLEDGLYTTMTSIPSVESPTEYLVSIDFEEDEFSQLLNLLPEKQAISISNTLKRQPYTIYLKDSSEFKFGVVMQLTQNIIHNAEEAYLPFKVTEFIPYLNIEGKVV